MLTQPTECPADRRDIPPGLAVVFVVMAVVAVLAGISVRAESNAWLAVDIPVSVLTCVLVPVLLRRPVLGALLLAALAVLSPAATPAATIGTLHVAQRRPFLLAIGVGAAGIAAHAGRELWRPAGGISYGWWLTLVLIAHAGLIGWGALAQARRALLDSLRDRAERAEAEQERRVAEARVLERTRIAREMHDVLAHRLSLLATYAGALEYRPDASPEQLSRAAGVVRSGVHQALGELREVIGVLRDTDDVGAEERPQPVLADLPRLVEESRDAGASVRLEDRVTEPDELPGAAGRTAYRVVQEGLTNARKHAAGQPVEVLLDGRPGTGLVIDIRNPMSGEAATGLPGSGTGLIGLAERVQLSGGRLDHEVTGSGEFLLHASLPWPA